MFGLIHCVIMEMIQNDHGMGMWKKILEANKLDEEEDFKMLERYPDNKTEALMEAVRQKLNQSLNDVLKMAGRYFLTYLLKKGYDELLTTLGKDLVSFIQNMDSVHSSVLASYASSCNAPSFRCVQDGNGKLTVHHYSIRKGLYPFVTGMIEAVGKELFGQNVSLTFRSEKKEKIGAEKTAFQFHTVLSLSFGDVPLKGESRMYAPSYLKCCTIDRETFRFTQDRGPGTQSNIRTEDFCAAFPYHFLLDLTLRIRQCGNTIKRLSIVPLKDGTPFQDIGIILEPGIRPTAENIFKFINSVFVIAIYRRSEQEPFILRGQFMRLSHSNHLLFVGSPRLRSSDDLKGMNIFLADIPLYDATRDLVFLNQQYTAESEQLKMLEATSKSLEEEKRKTEKLLHDILPKKIAAQLADGQVVKGERFGNCTVLFSDIVTFTKISTECRVDDVVNMLNEMYHRFDVHAETHGVYKVKTIGDAYVAAAGVPSVQADHAERMADFAMDMVEEAGNIISPATSLPLQIRVGMHSGGLVAGVIGIKKPRYDIYGDTVNIASRMESDSVPGRINVSFVTFNKLCPLGYKFKKNIDVSSKEGELMETFFLVGSSTRSISEPYDEFTDCELVYEPSPGVVRISKRTEHMPVIPKISIESVTAKQRVVKRMPSLRVFLTFRNSLVSRRSSRKRGPSRAPESRMTDGRLYQQSGPDEGPETSGGCLGTLLTFLGLRPKGTPSATSIRIAEEEP